MTPLQRTYIMQAEPGKIRITILPFRLH